MSVERKLKVAYDIGTLKEVALKLGHKVEENAKVTGYYGAGTKANLVIKGKGTKYDIGFNLNKDGTTEIVGDFHGGHIDKQLEEIIPAYIERKLRKTRFKIRSKVGDRQTIRLSIG